MLVLKGKVTGEDASVQTTLTKTDCQNALSACQVHSVSKLHVLKKGKSAAQFFLKASHASHVAERHGFDLIFVVNKSDLENALKTTEKNR